MQWPICSLFSNHKGTPQPDKEKSTPIPSNLLPRKLVTESVDQWKEEYPDINLAKLKVQLKPFVDLVESREDNHVTLKLKHGTGYGTGLLDKPQINVSDWKSSKGTMFDCHEHGNIVQEWIIVYEGVMEIEFPDTQEKFTLAVGDCLYVSPGVAHSANTIEDVKYITVTVPAASGFPEGG